MLERVIENWLDKANERLFQFPFCHMLAAQGYKVVHLTRHCAMEMGKDILAIDSEGIPCAFQLKGTTGKISLNDWRNGLSQQVFDLITGAIVHPSIDSAKKHKSFLVTNGELEEEVIRAIEDQNKSLESNGYYPLRTIVKGELFGMAKALGTDFWPFEIMEVKTLLELCLEDGKGIFPKKKLAQLLEANLPLTSDKKYSHNDLGRAISSSGILCSLASSNFTRENNFVAEIEAWVLYSSYVLALNEKWELPRKYWINDFEIARQQILNLLGNLFDEIKGREYLIEGNHLVDQPFFRIRVTWLLAFTSVYFLFKKSSGIDFIEDEEEQIRTFFNKYKDRINLWGEAAIPQILASYWLYKKLDATLHPDFLLRDIIVAIARINKQEKDEAALLAPPYYEAIDVMPHILSLPDGKIEDSFEGASYTIEGLFQLFIRRNFKQSAKAIWPDISRLAFLTFEPEDSCEFFRWRTDKGINKTTLPNSLQYWDELKAVVFESEGTCIPESIKENPVLLLLFLIVYPHRINSEIMRWLDTKIMAI